MEKYPRGALSVDAQYTPVVRALHRGNHWIEALPDNPNDKELYHELKTSVPLDPTERALPYYDRKECIEAISHVFVPLDVAGSITRKIFSAIREGYVSRNPLSNQMRQNLSETQKCVINRDSSFSTISGSNANAYGFCVVGDSGMGKTTIVSHALSLFPQVIVHSQYNDMAFPNIQLVWMRLDCPHDASVKGLCSTFFRQFDEMTGDNTYAKHARNGRATVDQMIPQMALLAQRHGLGLLVIDEIQNLQAAKSGGEQRMKNFIVQLVNMIGIPILLVGTPPAIEILSSDLMTIRRSSGQQGMSIIHPFTKGSTDWSMFVKGIWKYQWTNVKTDLTEELNDTLYSASRGNLALSICLFKEAQRIAIDNGQVNRDERMTPRVLRAAIESDAFKYALAWLDLELGIIEHLL